MLREDWGSEGCIYKTKNAEGCLQTTKLQREHGSVNTLILNSEPFELWDNKCLWFYATQFGVMWQQP